ncbi:MAG: phosphotransferase family protein [Myxococcota bacterium]
MLRIDPTAGKGEPGLAGSGVGLVGEFRLLQAAHEAGVPVPRPFLENDDPEVLGGPFYIMERIEGETIPRRIFRSESLAGARDRLPEQLGRALARVHRIELDRLDSSRLPAPRLGQTVPETQLLQIRAGFDASPRPAPVLELIYRWLEEHLPPETERTLVHGDFRIGNVIVGPEGLEAVLDWELAHIGDPHEDLAWMCTRTWRFGEVERPVGGIGALEPFHRAYQEESGRSIDPEALRFWSALSSAKCAVVWIFQLRSYLSGVVPSVEQATIGRRLAETEWDLLEILS